MKKERLASFIILALTGTLVLWYILGIRSGLSEIYAGSSESWLKWVVDKIYPRFSVEKARFPLSFFLDKADQVIIRFSLISLIIALFLLLKTSSEKFQKAWMKYLHGTTSMLNISMIRILFPSVLLWIYKDVWWDLMSHYELRVFYKPVLIFKIFNIGYPTPIIILTLCIILLLSCVSTIINFRPAISSFIAMLSFVIIEGFLNSFEKINHGEATLTYCALIFPFLMLDHQKASRKKSEYQDSWALGLITFLICLSYLQSGLEKLFIGGLSWLSPDTLRNYILLHQAPAGLWIADNNTLLILLSLAALIFQLGFIFILVSRYKYLFLLSGILFHLGVYFLLDVGWYVNSWMLSYLFFIDWKSITLKLSRVFPFLSKIVAPGKE
jgi:hypothetical protein